MNIVILRSFVMVRKSPIVYSVYIGYYCVAEWFCCIPVTLYDPQTLSIPSGKCLGTPKPHTPCRGTLYTMYIT